MQTHPHTVQPQTRAIGSPDMAAKAKAAREAAQEHARQNLKLDFADAPYWRALAGMYNVRLPAWYVTVTGARLRRFADRIGLSLEQAQAATGCKTMAAIARQNPQYPLFAHVGLLLEIARDIGIAPSTRAASGEETTH